MMKKKEEGRGTEGELIKGSERTTGSPLSSEILTISGTQYRMLDRRVKPYKCVTQNESVSISKPKPQHDITSLFFLILGSFTTNHGNQKHYYLHLPWGIHDFKGQRETSLHHS